jgi:hypothetical protein
MNNEKNKPISFSNSFGALTSEEIHIHSFEIRIPLLFKNIKKIQFVKKRRLHFNFFLLLLSVFTFWMMFYNNIFFIPNEVLSVSGIMLLTAAVFYRTSEREFIILTKFDFIKIQVEASLEQDSKKFISEFNKYQN